MNVKADLVLRNADIVTLDPHNPTAQALAVKHGRIVAIGSNEAVDDVCDQNTESRDLGGACVIPGFNDTHAHMEREGLKEQRLSLAGAQSIDDILARIKSAAGTSAPGEWIVTMPVGDPPHYFDALATIAEKRMPSRAELDAAAPQNPVYIPALFGNWGAPPGYTALNSAGVALNGLTRHSCPRCKGVRIMCDASSGEPTGAIVEHNPRPTVEFDLLPAVPRFGFAERRAGLQRSIALYHAKGTTSIYEGHGSAPETISVYRDLWEHGELTMRTGLCVSPSWSTVEEAKRAMRDWLAYAKGRGLGDPFLRISGVHIAYGGDAMVAQVARENLPDTGWSGFVEQVHGKDDFREVCFLAAEHDLRLHTIVGNDLHEILPVLEAINDRHPLAGRRWVIEHVARARLEDLAALHRLGIHVTTIPAYYLWKGGGAFLDEPDDGNAVVPHRAMLDLGLPVAIATDNIPYDPLFTLWVTAIRQERTTGRVIGPAQRLDLETALRLFTVAGAYLTFDEDWKGPLKVGYAADLTAFSGNVSRVSPNEVRSLECLMTWVDGRQVYSKT